MIFKALMKSEPVNTSLMQPESWFSQLFGQKSSTGEVVTAQSSLGVPTVYACVNILANAVAKLPMMTYKRGSTGRIRENNHIVSHLLEKRPNRYQSPFVFKHLVETHRNLWGNAYINISWGVDGRPNELWLLNPTLTEPRMDYNTNTLWYYTTLPNGEYVRLSAGDVIHLKSLSTDGLKGKSPIQCARENVGSSQSAQKFKGKFYANGASMSGVLKVPSLVSPEAKNNIRSEWERMNTGLDNAQRIAILDAGLDFQSISMPLKDAQFIETMKYDKEEIATIFNIPLHMVNSLDRATFSNIEQQSLDFIQNTLDPILVQYEQEFTHQLFSYKEQEIFYVKFNLNSLLRGDSITRAQFYEKMLDKGVYSINKVLELEDENGIGAMGDVHRVDLNHVSIDIADEYQLSKAGATKGGENSE